MKDRTVTDGLKTGGMKTDGMKTGGSKTGGKFLGFEGEKAKKAKKALIISLSAIAVLAILYLTAVLIYRAELRKKYPFSAINYSGNTIDTRFKLLDGFERKTYSEGSTEYVIQHLHLKKFGLGSYYYSDGKRNFNAGMWGVVDEKKAVLPAEFDISDTVSEENKDIDAALLSAGYERVSDNGLIAPGVVVVPDNTEDGTAVFEGIVADVCTDGKGRVLFLILFISDRSEPYVYCTYESGLGCWEDADGGYRFYTKK